MAASTTQLMDFTLGFAEADKAWAEWISWVLESAGYTVTSADLVQVERDAIDSSHLIVLLSENCRPDFQYEKLVQRFLARQPAHKEPRVFPIILVGYDLPENLPSAYLTSFTDCDRQEAQRRLLDKAKTSPLPFNPPPLPPFRKPQPPFPGEPPGGTPRKERGTAQGYIEKLTDGVQIEMMQIPGGMFTMGAPETEEGSQNSERPTRRVKVQPFCMGRYPVTQAQWRFVAGLSQIDRKLNPDPTRFKGSDKPVERISWLEAVEFCARLSQRTGREYRLPTEAEWEYACRGKSLELTPFHFGQIIDPEIANYDANRVYGQGRKGFYREQTTAVGSFKVANDFGLYDMHGNVWEWCMDQWHGSYEGAPLDGTAWIDAKKDAPRVLRGGSWYSNPVDCRSASRDRLDAVYRDFYIGFRLVSPARILP
jgi:formylglycine-generating enzyme required for sulfatase activity